MRQALSEAGFANIFANFLGQGLERLVDEDEAALYAVADLPLPLLEACCNNLRIRSDFADTYVLAKSPSSDLHLSLDALVARIDLEEEPHMVLFVPQEAQGEALPVEVFTPVDTFRNLEVMEQNLIQKINKVPVYKRIATLWSQHAIERIPIVRRLEYLINIVSLCVEAEEMGQFFHQLDLIPDRNPDVTDNFSDRLARNAWATGALCNSELPVGERVAAIGLQNPALCERLCGVLAGIETLTPASLSAALFAAECDNAGLSFDNWRFAEESGW